MSVSLRLELRIYEAFSPNPPHRRQAGVRLHARGGLLVLTFRDRLYYLLSFTAGVLLGVVCFEVLPEIFELAHRHELSTVSPMVAMVIEFLFFHGIESFY